MPRPLPKRAEPAYLGNAKPLPPDAEREIARILGNQSELAVLDTNFVLMSHSKEHLDNMPRYSDYLHEFKTLKANAKKFTKSISGVSGFYTSQFKSHGFDLNKLLEDIESFKRVCDLVVIESQNRNSSGRPVIFALMTTICQLCDLFDQYYQGPRNATRKRQGMIEESTIEEKRRFEYIEIALYTTEILKRTQETPDGKGKHTDQRKLGDYIRDALHMWKSNQTDKGT